MAQTSTQSINSLEIAISTSKSPPSTSNGSRKSFLIDSLLEERQKQLAAAMNSKTNKNTESSLLEADEKIINFCDNSHEKHLCEERESCDEHSSKCKKKSSFLIPSIKITKSDEANCPPADPSPSDYYPDNNRYNSNNNNNQKNDKNCSTNEKTPAFLNLFSKFITTNQQQILHQQIALQQQQFLNGLLPQNQTAMSSSSMEYMNRVRLLQNAGLYAAAAAAMASNGNHRNPQNLLLNEFLNSQKNSQQQQQLSLKATINASQQQKLNKKNLLPEILTNQFNSDPIGSASVLVANMETFKTTIGSHINSSFNPDNNNITNINFDRPSTNKTSKSGQSTALNLTTKTLKSDLKTLGTRNLKTTIKKLPRSLSSNVKKYWCDICDKTFSRSNTLITHKRIHTGEKPFQCTECGRAFRQPGNLTRHAYTHSSHKPFVCLKCGKAFNRASNLTTHMRIHQNIENEETEQNDLN